MSVEDMFAVAAQLLIYAVAFGTLVLAVDSLDDSE